MNFLSTDIVAAQEKCDSSTARRWAAANGVQFVGQIPHKNYLWTEADNNPVPGEG